MLPGQNVEQVFAKRNAIIKGDHFVYAKKEKGWFHGSDYANKDAIYPYVLDVSALCREIALHFVNDEVDVVVGPTVGAVSLSQWTTYWFYNLRSNCHALAICADEEDVLEDRNIVMNIGDYIARNINASGLVSIARNTYDSISVIYKEKVGTQRLIKRGYDSLVRGRRCLVVEDIVNSGLTVAKTCQAITGLGGTVVGVGCLCNRSGGKVTAETLGVPKLVSLVDLDMKMFPEADCPICNEKGRGSVRLDLGKGKDFLARMGIKPGDM